MIFMVITYYCTYVFPSLDLFNLNATLADQGKRNLLLQRLKRKASLLKNLMTASTTCCPLSRQNKPSPPPENTQRGSSEFKDQGLRFHILQHAGSDVQHTCITWQTEKKGRLTTSISLHNFNDCTSDRCLCCEVLTYNQCDYVGWCCLVGRGET